MSRSQTALQDTIVAIATPPGRGAIGMVRLSGLQALVIAKQLFHSRSVLDEVPFRAVRGDLLDLDSSAPIDDGLAIYFPRPRSFTGEDVIEFHCHGAPIVLQRVVQMAIRSGARTALPGEFTMRAFLNGRINLTQAEGIRDLINAQTTYQAQLAVRQTRGELSFKLQPAKESLLSMIVHMESSVEFVEENLDTHTRNHIIDQLTNLETNLGALVATYKAGHLVRQGVSLAIIGRPNVGKSSLFNALLDSDRAIVTDLPGTTRDTLTESLAISGIPVRLVDTAGIRATTDVVEKIGVERSYAALNEADVVVLVVDVATGIQPEDENLMQLLGERHAVVVLNKTDLPHKVDEFTSAIERQHLDVPVVSVSAKTRSGLHELREAIWQVCSGASLDSQPDMLITDARHAEKLNETLEALSIARDALIEGYSEEVPLAGMHRALGALGEITGEVTVEQIFDRIFATFCIGK
ncbi:MAG TPA: tRNA uridine-5-carboxymethylaminomethyl(34) synthesis GTPase MnmE [Acidobacteriota bacterium]|nr:tRNA uridine-5-carboxymethylaminomethyl(34) synthesis GTPase MnmE [Acidobacteriota bacterium]HNJ42211.1 tRNA uridine-5-carboxymethylaminomethyl(34) synthesis GTPase MnmE [Acidobacteriota bacterium]